MFPHATSLALSLLLLVAASVCAQEMPPPQDAPHAPAASGAIHIGAGDLLDVSVYSVPEMTKRVRVTSSGEVYLPLVGYVHLDGLTIEQAQSEVEKRLVDGGFLKSPHVTIFVAEYATGVSIMGEIARPGVYPIFGARRLFDVIAAAGGLTKDAGRVVTVTRRDKPSEPINVTMWNDPVKNAESNIEIVQGDTIVVTKAGVVYVVGEVQSPSGFIMESNQNLTVLKALALAHGPTRTASLDKAKLIRKKPDGQVEELEVPLKKILQAKEKDLALQADDILFVPTSASKHAALRTLDAIINIATGVSVRRF